MQRIRLAGPVFALLLPMALSGQAAQPSQTTSSPAKPAAFVVADVHSSPFSFTGKYFHLAPFNGDRFIAHQATPLELVTMAYEVEPEAVTGGSPGWRSIASTLWRSCRRVQLRAIRRSCCRLC